MKKIICVTGKSGSGKTTFAKQLCDIINASYINIDDIGKNCYNNKTVYESIVKAFGNGVVINGKINTKMLGQVVFLNKSKMQILIKLTWPFMENLIDVTIAQSKNDIVVLDWALLPKVKYFNKSKINILIVGNEEYRKEKIIKRDNITSEYYLMRESAGINYEYYKFNYVICNNYDKMFVIENNNIINKIKGNLL